MVTRTLLRLMWLPLVMLAIVAGALRVGRLHPNMTIAYNGLCKGSNGTCIFDAYTQRAYYLSHFVGVSWTPDMRRAADTDQGRLRIYRPNGQVLRTVVDNGKYFTAPQWSPDGQYLLYESTDRTKPVLEYSLWLMDTYTDAQTLLLELPGPTFGEKAAWSSDGERFVYFIGEELHLCTAAESTCQLAALTDNPKADWSPDGKHVAFSPGADRVQVFDGVTGETVFREVLFPDKEDMALLGVMWLDNNTLIFTHSLDGTAYTLNINNPTPRALPNVAKTLAPFMSEYGITMEAAVYHFGDLEPDLLRVRQFSPVGNSVPPSVYIGDDTGYYIGVVR